MPKCPCIGCTKETGRSEHCHNESCPHGWLEWRRQYTEAKEAERNRGLGEAAYKDILMRRLRRGKKGAQK